MKHTLIAALKYILTADAWFKPTKKDLLIEFREEPSLINYTENITGIRYGQNELKDAFLKMVDHADIITLKGEEILAIKDIPARKGSSLEDVGKIVKSYGGPKDWENIVDRVKNGKDMPMPIIEKKENGELQAMGGRTRLSAAALLDVPCEIIVLDTKSIKPLFFETKLETKLSVFMLVPDSQEFGEKYTKFLLGLNRKPEPPSEIPEDELKFILEEAKDIAKSMKSYLNIIRRP
jgi:hypothetical protein